MEKYLAWFREQVEQRNILENCIHGKNISHGLEGK
jgi:hypothetical protein